MEIEKFTKKAWESAKTLWTVFMSNPIRSTLRFMALLLVIEVILSLIGELLRIKAIQYVSDPFEGLVLVLFAWILYSGQISRFLVSVFLFIVFVLSTVFIIIPIDEIVKVVNKSLESPAVMSYRFDWTLKDAQSALDYYSKSPRLAPEIRADLSNTRKRLKEVQDSVKMEELYPEEKLQFYTFNALQFFLKEGAPFIFAMLMGALGSSIVITNQLIKNYSAQPAIWYIYRLIQGMVMALLLVYGFAAGMLSLGTQQPIQLNEFDKIKYFIGFISALAGLFSEQAFAKLREISKTLFGYKTGLSTTHAGKTTASKPEDEV